MSFIVLAGIIAIGTRSIVFRNTGILMINPPEANVLGEDIPVPIGVKVTGYFSFQGEHQQRFACMRSELERTDIVSLAVFAQIDATSKFIGITTSKRLGEWYVEIRPWLLEKIELVKQYWESSAFPAVRLEHLRGLMADEEIDEFEYTEQVIIAFNSEVERTAFIEMCRRSERHAPSEAY